MFNLKNNGEVSITIGSKRFNSRPQLKETISVNRNDEKVLCRDIKLKENFPGKYALVSVKGNNAAD